MGKHTQTCTHLANAQKYFHNPTHTHTKVHTCLDIYSLILAYTCLQSPKRNCTNSQKQCAHKTLGLHRWQKYSPTEIHMHKSVYTSKEMHMHIKHMPNHTHMLTNMQMYDTYTSTQSCTQACIHTITCSHTHL
jgi:hypothetical protein